MWHRRQVCDYLEVLVSRQVPARVPPAGVLKSGIRSSRGARRDGRCPRRALPEACHQEDGENRDGPDDQDRDKQMQEGVVNATEAMVSIHVDK